MRYGLRTWTESRTVRGLTRLLPGPSKASPQDIFDGLWEILYTRDMAEPVRKHDWQITARFPEGPDPEPPEEEPGITLLRWIPGWVGEFPTLRDKLIGFRVVVPEEC